MNTWITILTLNEHMNNNIDTNMYNTWITMNNNIDTKLTHE
jgi:hypothetical protein